MTPLNTILTWFKTGDFPTEKQFAEAWSSFDHKSESLPIERITGLAQAFQNTVALEVFDNYKKSTDDAIGLRVKLDASNLSAAHIISWKNALSITKIATVDSSPDIKDGNVNTKEQITAIVDLLHQKIDGYGDVIDQIRESLKSNDINLDELQEVVNYIKKNREDIDAIKAIPIGETSEERVKLKNAYDSLAAGLKTQQDLNGAIVAKLANLATPQKDTAINTINGSAQIPNPFETSFVIVQVRDSITGKRVEVEDYVTANTIQINLLTDNTNPLHVLMHKITR